MKYAESEDGRAWGVDMLKVRGFWGFGMVGVRAKGCPVSGALGMRALCEGRGGSLMAVSSTRASAECPKPYFFTI